MLRVSVCKHSREDPGQWYNVSHTIKIKATYSSGGGNYTCRSSLPKCWGVGEAFAWLADGDKMKRSETKPNMTRGMG